jgi:EAL domain-containing protein (putative c-di-GMP-specific phosphodiesterase class I)
LKSHILDPGTGRPTVAAVLEDVRQMLERNDVVGLIYVDLGGGARLEAQHGWQAYDEAVTVAGGALDAARGEGLLLPGDIVAPLAARSDKCVVFVARPAGEVTSEYLSTLGAALRDALGQALSRAGSRVATPQIGVARIHRDPMLRFERAVHRSLDEAMFMSLRSRGLEDERQGRWLDGVIEAESVVTLFQPIVDLRTLAVQAHEVTTHGPEGGLIEEPEALFALAERTGRALIFERLCRRQALLACARSSLGSRQIFLKVSATAVNDPSFAPHGFARELDGTGFTPGNLVIEVEERLAALDRAAFRAALRSLKEQGFRIAIDDMGAGYSSLNSIVEMEPDFLKFDMSLVRHLDRSPIKRGLLETVVGLSTKVQAPVIAEGIETAEELAVIRDLGVPLGQGFHLQAPEPARAS